MPAADVHDKFDEPVAKVIKPSKLAHVVLKTTAEKFKPMAHFYKEFLGGEASFENEMVSFITYDDEHHRVAVLAMPDTVPKEPQAAGLLHIAFTFDSLQDLALSYRQRKARGILPVWSVNHGITTSIYYADPDGNQVETQVDGFPTAAEATAYMESQAFRENPVGVDFDPEELVDRLRRGEDQKMILKRPNIGARGIPEGI